MAKNDPFESAKLSAPTLINGEWRDKGDSVKVLPFQKRHLVEAHYCEGSIPEDIVGPGEKEQGALDALKKPEDRDDMDVFSVQKVHEEFAAFDAPAGSSAESGSGSASKSGKS